MSNMDEFLKDYIFSGIDDEGLTSNDEELMRYFYGDEAMDAFANQTVKSEHRNNGSNERNDDGLSFLDRFRPTPEATQTEEDAIRHIEEACEDSRKMTIREFVVKYNPTWVTEGESDILFGIQSARTIIGVVDLDWAITLAGFNLGIFRIGIIPNSLLYIPGKPLWNLLRGYRISNNFMTENERRAIAMADLMTHGGMKFHEFFQ